LFFNEKKNNKKTKTNINIHVSDTYPHVGRIFALLSGAILAVIKLTVGAVLKASEETSAPFVYILRQTTAGATSGRLRLMDNDYLWLLRLLRRMLLIIWKHACCLSATFYTP